MSRAKHRALKHAEAMHLLALAAGVAVSRDHLKADQVLSGDITIGDGGILIMRWRTERDVKP